MPNYEAGIAVRGFSQLQRALRRIEDGVQPELRMRLRGIGEHVKTEAISNISHKTGRTGASPTIAAGMKLSVLQRGASIYTTAPHGGAINVGANVGARRGPHINRGSASHYMDRAVTSSQAFVQQETEAVLDWLTSTFQE